MATINNLLKNKENPKLILEAFEFAKIAYKDKFRLNGENYIEHALRVALFLDKMGVDEGTLIAALLHDTVDEKPVAHQKKDLEEIERKFGKTVADLIEKIEKLRKIRFSITAKIKEKKDITKDRIENLRKTFIALAGDLRVILIELVSRLDGLEYLGTLPDKEQQKIFALETLEIFAPIANRLSLGQLKRLLEDQSFVHLMPDKYEWLQENIKEKYEEREKYIRKFIPKLSKILKKEHVNFTEINYRTKSHWSTYRKLLRKNMDIGKIHDLIAVRIITEKVEDCYKVLGVLHKYFKPISGEIDDYIAKPKINGYRSLHTSVFLDKDHISEIQIRTHQMHKEAEYGVCAHWSYKEKIDLKKESKKYEWVRNLDFFKNQVFVFSPKGDIFSLPKGSTIIDFAYAVHSDIGNHCESAKIAGHIVPLSYELENADVVEIITGKNKQPSQDWLKFIKTSQAKAHIKKFFETPKSSFKLPIPHFIRKKIAEIAERAQKKKEDKQRVAKDGPRQIVIAGQKGMLVSGAKCCNPQPGDKVQAYLAKHREAIVLHKINCDNFRKLSEKFPEKVINANWE